MSTRTITMYSPSGQRVQVDPRLAYQKQQQGYTYTPPVGLGSGFPSFSELGSRTSQEDTYVQVNPATTPKQNVDVGELFDKRSAQRTQSTMEGLDRVIPRTTALIQGFGQMDVVNYVHYDSYGNLYWKDSADQSAVDNLMKAGLSEAEANQAIMRVEQSLNIRPSGEFTALGPDQNMPFPPAGSSFFSDPYGSYGGGGGSAGPVYTPPDRRVVEENAKNQMVALIGRIESQSVDKIVDAYMRDHRKAWEGASLDPNMTMLEELRNLESYKKIHKLRPDSASEATWVSQHRNAWAQGGGRVGEAEGRAIDLATIGATASIDNAAIAEYGEGFETDTFRDRMRRAASVAVGQVA